MNTAGSILRGKLARFAQQSKLVSNLVNVRRRQAWLLDNATPQTFANANLAMAHYVAKSRVLRSWPVFLKIDLSPACNLACTVCVHAPPDGNPELERQQFATNQKMDLGLLEQIVSEVKGKTAALSMYYLGDPLMYPRLNEAAQVAARAGLNTHISSNFSFHLSDQKIRDLVTSGLTHISVAVDGFTQQTYERTRVGGRLDWVRSNLERLVAYRRRLGQRYPRIEVQYIRFRHNEHERDQALTYFRGLGVDQVFDFWGSAHNYTDTDVRSRTVGEPREPGGLPKCWWPYLAMLIRFDGAVLPCCSLRLTEQYVGGDGDDRAVGTIRGGDLWSIWNGSHYQEMRKLLADPAKVHGPETEARSFCYGCNNVYHTNVDALWKSSDRHDVPESRRRRLRVA